MSTVEYVIWHILGYAAIPTILIAGFVAVAGVSVFALSFTADKDKT